MNIRFCALETCDNILQDHQSKFCSVKCGNKNANQRSAEKAKFLREEKIQDYNNNPKHCAELSCGRILPYEKRMNKFCDHSCSAKTSNNIPKRKIKGVIILQDQDQLKSVKKKSSIRQERRVAIEPIVISKITGQPYDKNTDKNTWHDQNRRYKSAKRLSEMFNFELQKETTIENITKSLDHLQYLYEEEQLSTTEIASMFPNTQGFMIEKLLKLFCNIKLRSRADGGVYANKLFDHKSDNEFNSLWEYRKLANFRFAINEYPKITGYDQVSIYGWYNSKTNTKHGISRDHMFSVKAGYDLNIPPSIISHPANCHLIPQFANSSKGKKCSITLEELYERIANWT